MQKFQNSIISLKMLYHCFASFKQSPLDFFKLVDLRLILMLLYDSLNLIISGVHQSHLGSWGHRSEKGLDRVAYKMFQCQSFWKTKLLSAMCSVAINILLRWYNTSVMLSIDMQFMPDEEKLSFLTWHPSGLTPWQIWWLLSVCETGSWMPCSLSWSCLVHTSYHFMNEK